jgi:inner membrane protein
MASAFGHVAVAYALGKTYRPHGSIARFWGLTVFCCLLPDLDVLGFFVGIPYGHMWGHRGLTHSLVFAILVGVVIAPLVSPSGSVGTHSYWLSALYFSLVTLSHGILDALTDGGLGVAFFAPFDTTRYFFPWRPISVSPIGIAQFFSEYGLGVVLSELLWIGIPVGLWLVFLQVKRRIGAQGARDSHHTET